MKQVRYTISAIILGFSQHSLALECYATFMKSDCWQGHKVTLTVKNKINHKQTFPDMVLEKNLWKRIKIKCQPKDTTVMFSSQFTPAIWESNKGKIYHGKFGGRFPVNPKSAVSNWELSICFPTDFIEVPILPTQTGQCTCDKIKSSIPTIKSHFD